MSDKLASEPDVIHHSPAHLIANSSTLHQGLLLGLLPVTAWFRLWQLNVIPPGLWFDEAYNAMDAVVPCG